MFRRWICCSWALDLLLLGRKNQSRSTQSEQQEFHLIPTGNCRDFPYNKERLWDTMSTIRRRHHLLLNQKLFFAIALKSLTVERNGTDSDRTTSTTNIDLFLEKQPYLPEGAFDKSSWSFSEKVGNVCNRNADKLLNDAMNILKIKDTSHSCSLRAIMVAAWTHLTDLYQNHFGIWYHDLYRCQSEHIKLLHHWVERLVR